MQDQCIDTTWVDTRPLALAEQFSCWAAHGAASRYSRVDTGPFLAHGAFWHLGQAVVISAEVDPFVSTRDAACIAERPMDHIQLVALLDGRLRFETDAAIVDCIAPCVLACDYSRPYRLISGRTRVAGVYLSRPFLEGVAGRVSAHGPLPPSPESTMLATTLSTLVGLLPFVARHSAGHYAHMLRELAAAALLDGAPARAGADNDARRRVEARLVAAPPGSITTLDELCVAAAVSRSALFRLFRRDGGVRAWDRTRRLRLVYRAASDTADHRSLSEIGAAFGFGDNAGLARAFRAQFGLPPSEVRRRTTMLPSPVADTAFRLLRTSISSLAR